MTLDILRKETTPVPVSLMFAIIAIYERLWGRELEAYLVNPDAAPLFGALLEVDRWQRSGLGPPRSADSGLCPQCHRHDGLICCASSYWGVCHEHRVRWHAGVMTERELARPPIHAALDAKVFLAYECVAPAGAEPEAPAGTGRLRM